MNFGPPGSGASTEFCTAADDRLPELLTDGTGWGAFYVGAAQASVPSSRHDPLRHHVDGTHPMPARDGDIPVAINAEYYRQRASARRTYSDAAMALRPGRGGGPFGGEKPLSPSGVNDDLEGAPCSDCSQAVAIPGLRAIADYQNALT